VVPATGAAPPPVGAPAPRPAVAVAAEASPSSPPSPLPTPSGPPPLPVIRIDTSLVDDTAHRSGAPKVVSAAGILVDIDSQEVLWQHNPDERRAPASTSKLMTALVALYNFPMSQAVTVSPPAANRDGVETKMGLHAGETLTVKELLTGMLVVSANDAAMSMAYDTVGMDRFVATMNAQADAMGLHDSHFVNPSGYPDDPAEVSSARDLAAMMMVAWKYFPVFDELAGVRGDLTLPATATHPAYPMHNVMSRIFTYYPPTVAGKSGFTDAAGPCVVTVATRGSHHLVLVLLDAEAMVRDNGPLLDWGFVQEGLPPLIVPSPSPSPGASPSPSPKRVR
ncbi:MAG: serine hydrolase, partial [Candidatus Dormiibacterota bacterium]